MFQYLVFIGVAVQIWGCYEYIKDMLAGRTKPNRVTWLLWSVAPLIATVASVADGVTWAAVPVFMSGFCPLIILICSFANKNAYWKLEKFDYLCGLFSVLALILWAITQQPFVAIIFAVLSDGLAAVPTLVKAWRFPETESGEAYTSGLINALSSVGAIKFTDASQYVFPLYLISINIALIFSVYRKRLIKNTL